MYLGGMEEGRKPEAETLKKKEISLESQTNCVCLLQLLKRLEKI